MDRGTYLEMPGLHKNTTYQQQVPVVWLYPKNWKNRATIFLSPDGKAGIYGPDGNPRPEVAALLRSGVSVCGIDLFMQGEFLPDGKSLTQTRRVRNTREAACYTLGYNRPLFAHRVHDILSAIRMIQTNLHAAQKIDLVGLRGAGHWAAAANFAAGKTLDRVTVETGGFRFIQVADIRHPDLMPGAAKYGDIETLLRLAPNKVWSVDDRGLPAWLR